MGIDYRKYGLDPSLGSADAALKMAAYKAATDAANVEVAMLLETDKDDKALLAERLAGAQKTAGDLRIKAKLTKREVADYRTRAIRETEMQFAQRHLAIEQQIQEKTAAGSAIDAERAEQARIESGLTAFSRLV